jgi:hypothetical protein
MSPPEVREKLRKGSQSEKAKAALAKMLADPDRVRKAVAARKANAKKKRKKIPENPPPPPPTDIRSILPHSKTSGGGTKYSHVWVSVVEKKYRLTVSLTLVLKFGRPRDPWGHFMVPLSPEKLFGAPVPLRKEQKFIQEGPHESESHAVCIVES